MGFSQWEVHSGNRKMEKGYRLYGIYYNSTKVGRIEDNYEAITPTMAASLLTTLLCDYYFS